MAYASTDSSNGTSLRSLLRFTAISGTGWLLDFGLLFVLVQFARFPAFIANLVSATIAGVLVFLVSRKVAFRGQQDSVLLRTLIYFAYTLGVIVLASALLSYLTWGTVAIASHFGLQFSRSVCVLLAKVIVTPLNFIANYFVAGVTSEYARAT